MKKERNKEEEFNQINDLYFNMTHKGTPEAQKLREILHDLTSVSNNEEYEARDNEFKNLPNKATMYGTYLKRSIDNFKNTLDRGENNPIFGVDKI